MMAKRQVKPGIFQESVGNVKDVLLGLKSLAGQSSGFLEQAAKVSPRKAAAVARSKLEEDGQVMDEELQELELDIKTEDQATGRKEAGKALLPEGERAGSPTYSDLSPRPSESSPVESPVSAATSISPTQKRPRNPTVLPPIIRTRRGSSAELSQSSSESGSKRPLSGNQETCNSNKLMHLVNGERSVVTLVSDVPEIPSVRPKRGPFHRGIQKKARPPEASHPLPLPLPSPPVTKTAPALPTPTTASPSDLVRSPLTRSTSAALKSVEFISLPGRKRRRRGDEGSVDSTGTSPLDAVSPEIDHPKMVEMESPSTKSERDTSSPVDTPQIKRKRGRPPKKRRDVRPATSTGATPTDASVSAEGGGTPGDGLPSRCAPDAHSSTASAAASTQDPIARLSTPSPQTILVFEESPLPPAGSLKPSSSVEQHGAARGPEGKPDQQAPILFGKSAEPTTKPVPSAKAAPPEINLPLWESFSTKQGSLEQKTGSDVSRAPHNQLSAQASLKPSKMTEFGCVTVPTIPSLLPQATPKTTPNHLPLHSSDPIPSFTTTHPTTVTSSPGSAPTPATAPIAGEVVKRDMSLCQPDACPVRPNDSTAVSVHVTQATSVTPVNAPAGSGDAAVTKVEGKLVALETEGGRGKGEEQRQLARVEVPSEPKEQRVTEAHDGAAIASAPDGESPAKPEGEKAEAMGSEASYLQTKPVPSPPSVGYKPKDASKQDKPLDGTLQVTPLHSSPVLSNKSGDRERKEAESSLDEKVPSNPIAHDPDSKSRSKIQELDTTSSMCYTLATPTAHYPPTTYPPSSYPYGPSYPLVYPPGGAPPTMYSSYFPPQQMPTAYLPGLHPPLSSEQTSGYYATPLSQVTTRPPAPAPIATTVSGVRVAILDKPPPQLPSQGGRPFAGNSGNFPPQPVEQQSQSSPTSRAFMPPGTEGQPGLSGRGTQPHPHPLSQTYRPGVTMVSSYMAPSFYPPYMDWAQVVPEREPAPPPPKPAPLKAQDPKLPSVDEHLPTQPVECPECGRMFKNNKALNGHMRLHGGFDWTKKPFGMGLSMEGGAKSSTEEKTKAKRSEASKNNSMTTITGTGSRSPSPTAGTVKSEHSRSHPQPKVFTFNNTGVKVKREASESRHHRFLDTTEHRNPTLDDLCRAVEELERKEKEASSDVHRHRPSNITIPQPGGGTALIERERRKLSVSPPYTPPPILSPARGSMSLLASPQIQPHTPNRILSHWNGRRNTTDSLKPSDSEESSFMEPKINVGKDFQAILPSLEEFHPGLMMDERASKVWAPIENLTLEEECTLDGYLELACSASVPYGGRNKEYALHILHYIGGSIKEAVRLLLLGKSPFPSDHHLSTYNYISTKKWSARERQQFRRAWRVHRKQFKFLRESCAQVGSTKTLPEIIEHYYTWKKYRNDEYRCRNRHASEEILTDDDDAYPEIHSSSSSGSTEQETTHAELHRHGDKADQHEKQDKLDLLQMDRADQKLPHAPSGTVTSSDPSEHLPVVYAPHTPRPSPGQPVHQYKCKYPGCNQVFTSIFALNGHIRIHGGSWYPKPHKADSCSAGNSQGNSLSTLSAGQMYSSGKLKSLGEDPRMYHHPHYELTKVLSLEVPQPGGASAYGMGCNNTPSPKPSPGKPRSPAKKKMSSSSPGEREGYYPCNRCGRVFTKVKSRSAHMKSHIIKQS